MDAFEPIRQSARDLHNQLVSDGTDPNAPMDLVQSAIACLDLELAWLPSDDPVMKGSRALYDEQAGLICCSNDEDEISKAVLVAHEVGHVCVHSSSTACAGNDIDVECSAEQASIGLQRVEDYGARERRELQANVFAREFLLPLDRAREHFIEGKQGASTIAAKLSLPLNLVRQQLLDGLLLPAKDSVDTETRGATSTTITPDPSQVRASEHEASAFQLQAGPGTGKTRTLVNRIQYLIDKGVDPASILVLTFSNKAAGELTDRIALKNPDAATKLWVGTFHAFGLDLIRRYYDRFDLDPKPELFDRSDAISVLEEILPILPLKHYKNLWDPSLVLRDILNAISRAKDEMTGPAHYQQLAQAMLDSASDEAETINGEKALEVASVYEQYEKALYKRKSVDFGDIIMRPTLLMEEDELVRKTVRLRHRHILVDEYQDVNSASARLLKAISGDGNRLWVVGDSRQSIYRFRGASSTSMASFSRDYPGATIDRLEINYRSTTPIVDSLKGVSPRMQSSVAMLPMKLKAHDASEGVRPQIRVYQTPDDEIAGLAHSIQELKKCGVDYRDQIVLSRTNSRLNEIALGLESCGIPVMHLGSLFERDEVRDLLALLSFAIDQVADGFVRLAATIRYRISLQDTFNIVGFLSGSRKPLLEALECSITEVKLEPSSIEALTLLCSDLALLNPNGSPWEFLTSYLLEDPNSIEHLVNPATVADQVRCIAVWQFVNFARESGPVKSGKPIQRLLDSVREMVLFAEERGLRQIPSNASHLNAVGMMTIHGSKGLEFEAVHLPGMIVTGLPSSYRGQRCPAPTGMIVGAGKESGISFARREHDEEEECLFFVALSRAKRHLRLYRAAKQKNGDTRKPSGFLQWLPNDCMGVHSNAETLPSVINSGTITSVKLVHRSDLQVSASLVQSYEKCPRRCFYTHFLHLRGARKTTAYQKTHDCIYDFNRWLALTRRTKQISSAEAKIQLDTIWQQKGPIDHGFAKEYRRIADTLVSTIISNGAEGSLNTSQSLRIDTAHGSVVVHPDEAVVDTDGTAVLRRVRTGRKRTKEYGKLEYALLELAAQQAYGLAYRIEALHISDDTLEPVTITPRVLGNRANTCEQILEHISAGEFPPKIDPTSCPRCPHFFICSSTPHGELSLP